MSESGGKVLPLRIVGGGAMADERREDAEDGRHGGMPDAIRHRRIVEALLFAADRPLSEEELARALPENADVGAIVEQLREDYAERGVNLVRVAGKWQMRTAEDLRWLLRREQAQPKRLSKAALETLAIIAYHQPVTRAEMEDIRGVAISRGTLDVLMQAGWVKIRGRRQVPGRPLTYGTTEEFLSHFGLENIDDLPGLRELKKAGLLDADIPDDLQLPDADAESALAPEEAEALFPAPEMEEEPPLEMHLQEPASDAEAQAGELDGSAADARKPGTEGG